MFTTHNGRIDILLPNSEKGELTLTFSASRMPSSLDTGHFEKATVANIAAHSHISPIRVAGPQISRVEICIMQVTI